MNNIKKTFLTITAFLLVVSMLAACGAKDDQGSQGSGSGSEIVDQLPGGEEIEGEDSTDGDNAVDDTQKPGGEVSGEQKPSGDADNNSTSTSKPNTSKPDTSNTNTSKPNTGTNNGNSNTTSKPNTGSGNTSSKPATSVKVSDVWKSIQNKLGDNLMATVELSEDDIKNLYGISSSDLVQISAYIPMMNVKAEEFFIAEVAEGKMSDVEASIKKRQAALDEQWKQYLPDQYEVVKKYKLVKNGNFIFYGVSENVDTAVNIFTSATK